jgi:hypothetical protein
MKSVAAVACALGLFATLAGAAPIYRCGQTYTQTPCPGGRLIDAADPRSAAQRAEARRTVERERRLAAQMERDRQAQEAGTPQAQATGFDAKAPPPAASQPVPAKGKKKRVKVVPRDVIVIAPKGTKGAAP